MVVALIANVRTRGDAASIQAFGTPIVVHLSETLTISTIMSEPWPSLLGASIALLICGFYGLGYSIIVLRRTRNQTGYKAEMEDWLWYVILPFGIYGVLTTSAQLICLSRTASTLRLFMVAAAALGLLLIAIRNAWDSVTHIVVNARDRGT